MNTGKRRDQSVNPGCMECWGFTHHEEHCSAWEPAETLDPEPYVSGLGNRHASNLNPAIWVFDPRPEYSQSEQDYR